MSESELYEAGLRVLRGAMSAEDWAARRRQFEDWRELPSSPTSDPYPGTPRPTTDEFGWYVFISEVATTDPYALDPDEAARVLPILTGLADRWEFATSITGLEQRLADLAGARRANPDNGLFEIAVALAYAARGHAVTLIPEEPGLRKTPDMKVKIDGVDMYVECKRQSKQSAYEQVERMHWARLWQPLEALLSEQRAALWLRIEFRSELSTYEDSYLADQLRIGIRNVTSEVVLIDDDVIKIEAKPVDMSIVDAHLENVYVKVRGTQERALLGGQWAPPRANMESLCTGRRMRPSRRMPEWQARSFWDQIDWGCGVAWQSTAEGAIDRKARDVKSLFARAIEQLPANSPSVVHLAAETLAGNEVEARRTEKIIASIKEFRAEKPVLGLLFHRIQSESPPDSAFNFDESITDFWQDSRLQDVSPRFVFIPRSVEARTGGHWEYY